MRINFIIFSIIIERANSRVIDQSIQRTRMIEDKINDMKNKYMI